MITMVIGADHHGFAHKEYIKQQLVFERNQPVDVNNDGNDSIRTT